MSEWKKKSWPIAKRILGEAALPALCGFVWGLFGYLQGKPPFDAASTGFAGFFFVFFLQGQVLRVAKNVGDKQNVEEWRTSFASIQEGLNVLQKHKAPSVNIGGSVASPTIDVPTTTTIHIPTLEAKATPFPPTIHASQLPTSATAMKDAVELYAEGRFEEGALAAAKAFDIATLEAGVRRGLSTSTYAGEILRIIAASEPDKRLEKLFFTLFRLRNNLFHGGHREVITSEKAEQLISAFGNGVDRLNVC